MRAFLVRLPSGARYWTVLDEDLAVVDDADAFLRHVRFGRDGSELTTRSYAGGIALFLRWCARTGRHWHDGVAALGLFITWLRHAGPQASGVDRPWSSKRAADADDRFLYLPVVVDEARVEQFGRVGRSL